MFDLDHWQEIWHTLAQNKLRSILTALGVFWGIFMLVLMLGFGNGLQRGVAKGMAGFATNAIYIWGQRTSIPYAGLQPGRSVDFEQDDVEAVARIDGLEYLAPRNQLGGFRDGNNVVRGDKTGNFQVTGDYPDFFRIQNVDLEKGRLLNHTDVEQARKVAVIGKRVAEELYEPGEDVIGTQITVQGIPFMVVGLFTSPATGERGDRQSGVVHLPFSTFAQAFQFGDRVGWFSLTVNPDTSAVDVENTVKSILAERHKVAPADKQAMGSFNMGETFGKMQSLFTGIEGLIWFVGLCTLLAGVIGVSNIMLIVVKERTKEIGVRKALGATPASVVGQVMQEAIVLTLMAGWLGLAAGVGLLELVARMVGDEATVFADPGVDLGTALVAAGVLLFTGLLAGLLPARLAAQVRPVEALRAD